jgi:hypothetical protein
MISIRRWVFETNSSSTHSISIEEWDLDFKTDSGIIEIETWEFWCSWWDYYDFYTKASYIRTWIVNTWNWTDEKIFKETICEFTWCEVICKRWEWNEYYPDGYIDHQSVDVWDFFSSYKESETKDKIKKFLFNSSSSLFIWNDNW